jgi:hypothetical protein
MAEDRRTRIDAAFQRIRALKFRLRWIRQTLRTCSDTCAWKTLRRLLSTHSLVTTVMPLKGGRGLRIRKTSLPNPEQALIYQNLGIRWKTAFTPLKSYANP